MHGVLPACVCILQSLLRMWQRQNRKVLLFTQSSQMLDILESFVQKEGYEYLRMDGSTSIGSRHVLVNRFNQVILLLFSLFYHYTIY